MNERQSETHAVSLAHSGGILDCQLVVLFKPGSGWFLTLGAADGLEWRGHDPESLWISFVELRGAFEPLGYRICCAGARIDANMRRGKWYGNDETELLTRRTLLGIRHTARLFDPAPPSAVGTVEEQEEHHRRWLATPWWKALIPTDPFH